jgi:indole-3-glycerol phosphate synthase
MPVFLDEIVQSTRARVAEAKRAVDLRELASRAESHIPRGFRRSLESAAASGVAIISELKKASPSKGVIRANLQIATIAKQFEDAGAAALSVLTEERYFQGSLANLIEASAATNLPCLRKDFIVDKFQVLEARANRADAILLIVAALGDSELSGLYAEARSLGLDVLCEVHDEAELDRALVAGFDIVGVNSRDLRTFKIDMDVPQRLSAKIPRNILRVAESGIHTGEDINRLRAAGFQAFLVGESLMRADAPGDALKHLVADVHAGAAKASSKN